MILEKEINMKGLSIFKTKEGVIIAAITAIMAGACIYGVFSYTQNASKNVAQIEDINIRTTRSITDNTKVTAKGDIPPGYSLKLVPVNTEEEDIKNKKHFMSADESVITTYDISITDDNGNEYQPVKTGDSVTLLIEDEAFKGYEDVTVYHIPDMGMIEALETTRVRDDAVTVETKGFSTYVFAGKSITTTGTQTATYFKTGKEVNEAIKKLVDPTATYETEDKNIISIVWDTKAFVSDVQLQAGGEPVYARYVEGTVYLYTAADKVYLNADSSYLFADLKIVSEINIPYDVNKANRLDTSLMADASSMFKGDLKLETLGRDRTGTEIGVAYWDMSGVTTVEKMFDSCEMLLFDCSYWNTESLTNSNYFVNNCSSLITLDISGWDMSKVTTAYGMFKNCSSLKALHLSDGSSDKTKGEKNKYYQELLMGCDSLKTVDLSDWDMSAGVDFKDMLACAELTEFKSPKVIEAADIKVPYYKWIIDDDSDNVSDDGVEYEYLKADNISHVYKLIPYTYTMLKTGEELNSIFKTLAGNLYVSCEDTDTRIKSVVWTDEDLSGDKAAVRIDCEGAKAYAKYENGTIKINTSVNKIYLNPDLQNMFLEYQGLEEAPFLENERIDASRVTILTSAFRKCANLKSLDLTGWDVSNVKMLNGAFNGCHSLEELDITGWTLKPENLNYTFQECKLLKELDVSKWDTSNLTTMEYTFSHVEALEELDVSKWDTSKCSSFYATFYCMLSVKALDVSGWDVSNGTNFYSTFQECSKVTELDVSNWDMSNATSTSQMFYRCYELKNIDLTRWNTPKLSNAMAMFYECRSLTKLDLSSFETAKVTRLDQMFMKCESLEELDISNMTIRSGADVSNILTHADKLHILKAPKTIAKDTVFVLNIYDGDWYMDKDKNLTIDEEERKEKYVELKNNITNSSYTYIKMGRDLQEVDDSDYSVLMPGNYFARAVVSIAAYAEHIEWTDEDISKKPGTRFTRVDCEGAPVYARYSTKTKILELHTTAKKVYFYPDSSYMFSGITHLVDVNFINDERIDTSRCTTLRAAFMGCSYIESLDLSTWDVSNVRTMESLFHNMRKLKDINMEGWNTENLENVYSLFAGCLALETVDVSNINTAKSNQLTRIFYNCESLKSVDISMWDAANVRTISELFYNCSSLTSVNVSGLTTTKVTKMTKAFYGCSSLTTLDLSDWDFSKCTTVDQYDFDGATNLVKIKAPKKTNASISFPTKDWGIDDDEDGVIDTATRYSAWRKGETKSRTYIRGNINTVSFVIVNGQEKIEPQSFIIGDTNARITVPTITKVGYMLNGWYTDEKCKTKYDVTKPVRSSFTLYAKWSRPTFLITFDANGGVLNGNKTKLVTYGGQYGGLPSAEKENAYFEGWRTPSGEVINSKNIVLISEAATFTAAWTDKEIFHTVTFESNGGAKVASQKVSKGKTVTKPNIKREGYIFNGWFFDKNFEIPWDFENDAVDDDITLYASWTKNITYKITFVTGDGLFPDGKKTKYVVVTEGEQITAPNEPERDRFLFAGWSADGATLFDMTTVPDKDLTLYAVWERTVFSVALDANGGKFSDGKQVHNIEVNKDEAVGIVETPVREGYVFKGWYYDGESRNMDSPIGSDMTIFAKWGRADEEEFPVPDDDPTPDDVPHDSNTKWTFRVVDGMPQIYRY